MADCNTCNGTYLSVEDLIRRSVRCNSEGKVAFVGTELNVFANSETVYADSTRTITIDGETMSYAEYFERDNERFSELYGYALPMPVISFIDDDGANGVLTKLKPLFTAKSVPIGLALIGNSPVITDAVKRAEIVDLQDTNGWEIISHTMTHLDISAASEAEYEADCQLFLQTFTEYGLNVKSIAFPWGHDNYHTEITKQYYESGFSTWVGNNTIQNLNEYKIKRIGLGSFNNNQTDLASFQILIDNAILNNEWIVFMTHCDYETNDMQIISDVLDYCVAQGVSILTPSEALKLYK